MKHYLDPSNQQVYAFEDDGSQDSFINPTFQLLTDDELAAIRAEQNPPLPPEKVIVQTRYTHEIAGVIWNGVFIDTSPNSYTKIQAAKTAAENGLRVDGDIWKCADPVTKAPIYMPATNAEIIDIAGRVFAYVQAGYTRESVLMAAVTAGTYTPDMLNDGWPSQALVPTPVKLQLAPQTPVAAEPQSTVTTQST